MRELGNGREIAWDPEDFIRRLRRKGVTLWLEGSGLRYRAPKGVLTSEERQALSRENEEIAARLACIARPAERDRAVREASWTRRAPLSFTQREYWRERFRYGGRPIRNIAAAYRLEGPLQVGLLKESVAIVGGRHDALRTRIVLCEDDLPMQEVSDTYLFELEVVSLRSVPEVEMRPEIDRQIELAILDARDYATSPLFRAVLLTIGASSHVLVLAMDHVIADLASLHLLSEEVFAAYVQLLRGYPVDLPRVAIQFPDLAARLTAQSPEMLTRVARRFDSIARTRFPEDVRGMPPGDKGGLGIVRFVISRDLCDELRMWARHRGTTIVIAMLTAYAATVLRWCGVGKTVIPFMTNGRISADLERTIGYLAFSIYIRASLESWNTFVDLLRAITQEYCRGRDEADFGYAKAGDVPPEFTRNAMLNWRPTGGPTHGILAPGTEVSLYRPTSELSSTLLQRVSEWDQEPDVGFFECDGAIAGQLIYDRSRFSDSSMARFAANVTEFLTAMLRTPTRRIMDMDLK